MGRLGKGKKEFRLCGKRNGNTMGAGDKKGFSGVCQKETVSRGEGFTKRWVKTGHGERKTSAKREVPVSPTKKT